MILVTFWIIILIISIILEAASAALVSIWFALGAIVSLIASVLGASQIVQYVLFLSVSIISLALTRPIIKKLFPKPYTPTNGDMDIGELAIVIQEINSEKQTGRIRIKGVDWPAKSTSGEVIPENASVVIERKESNIVYVKYPTLNTKV